MRAKQVQVGLSFYGIAGAQQKLEESYTNISCSLVSHLVGPYGLLIIMSLF